MALERLLVRDEYIEGMARSERRYMSTNYQGSQISGVIKGLMEREDRKDPEFRYAIYCTEVGDMADELFREEDEGATFAREAKALSIGQAAVMLLGLAYTRDIDYVQSVMAAPKDREVHLGVGVQGELRRLTHISGQIGKYITHDKRLNPGARPHKTREDEIRDYGRAIVHLDAICGESGFGIDYAVATGLKNWIDADWRKRTSSTDNPFQLYGKVACPGVVEAAAYVVSKKHPVNKAYLAAKKEKPILVMEHAMTDELMEAISHVSGVITDHGGYTCHAATVARQFNIPCIVGTGNATEKIKHGQKVIMLPTSHDDTGEVTIRPIKAAKAKNSGKKQR